MTAPYTRLNHYDVVSLIGEGGMGAVYRATDTRLNRDVALKVLPKDVTADEGRLARFRREARALAALNHPNIVTIYSVEESDGAHFLTMELVEGRTLDTVVTAGGIGVDTFLSIAVPLSDAVAAAHAAGLTHRDLKPQNVMIGEDGRVKVLDFGLARFMEGESNDARSADASMLRTQEGLIVGTLPYLAPEQVGAGTPDSRTDVFALGVMFYEMASGRRPFVRESPLALLAAIIRDQPAPIAELAPAYPAEVHEIIDRCLAKAPGDRYQDGAALSLALRDVSILPASGGFTSASSGSQPSRVDLRATPTTGPARSRSSGSPLVGRDAEFARLTEHVRAASAGEGALLLLGGEPGVGKTRLCEELLRTARRQGLLTLTGHCYEGGTTPYSPFVELLEQMLRDVPEAALRDVLGDDALDIARLVPRVRRYVDALAEPMVLEPEQQRRVLFTAVVDVLRRLSTRQPVVLLLDDIHWGDDATIGLLQQLVHHIAELRILCLGTYRDVAIDIGKPFEKAIATLVQEKHGVLLPVTCLPQGAVAEMLSSYAGRQAPHALLEAIFKETEGNPFFVRELFQHLSEDGQLFDDSGAWKRDLTIDALNVPAGVRLVIGRRLARLSESTQSLLATAAVVGRQFDLRLVEAMGSLEGDDFLDAVEEAERAKLISARREGRLTTYTFTHELIRSTLLSALSIPRLQRLHARVAKVMETTYGASVVSHASAMAHHLYEAGPAADDARTIHYLTLASDQAISTGALEDGLVRISRALSLVPDEDRSTRAALLWKQGLARRNIGQLFEAIIDWEGALELAQATDAPVIAGLCQDLAHGYAWTGRGLLGVAAARRGLAALGPEAASDRCRLTGALGWNYAIACDFASADPILRDALAMAESLGSVPLVGEALLLNSWHYYLCMRRREQADACHRAAELLRPTNDPGKLGEALVNYQMACIQVGRPGDIAPTLVEARTLAERLGRFDIRVHQLYSEALRGWLIDADLDALEEGFGRVLDVSGAWRWVAEGSQAQVRLYRGDVEGATAVAAAAVSHEPPGTTHTGFGWSMAFLCDCVAGRRAAALAVLSQHEAELPRPGMLNTIGAWSALFKVVEGLVMLDEREQAAAWYPLVIESLATESVVVFDGSHLLVTIAGMAAAAAGDWARAAVHYEEAVRLADEMPFGSEQAEARYWHARMRLERNGPGDRAEAMRLLDAALERYRGIGMPWHMSRATLATGDWR